MKRPRKTSSRFRSSLSEINGLRQNQNKFLKGIKKVQLLVWGDYPKTRVLSEIDKIIEIVE